VAQVDLPHFGERQLARGALQQAHAQPGFQLDLGSPKWGDQQRQNRPGTTVDYLDLAVDTPSHLSAESLVSQFLAADVIVVGAPKAWLWATPRRQKP
jgi:hypothetical protein